MNKKFELLFDDTIEVFGRKLFRVKPQKDYIVFKNSWSSFRWFTYTKSNKMWKAGCFYGTGQELIEKAYQDSEQSGKCYEAYVNLVLELEKTMTDKEKLEQINLSLEKFQRTGDVEHLDDVERILEYDGLADFEE